jgi:DNA-binding phage protein
MKMNSLASIADSLRAVARGTSDVQIANRTGLTRQSVAKALSGQHGYNVLTLLAITEALELELLIVPRDVARALRTPINAVSVPTMIDSIKDL